MKSVSNTWGVPKWAHTPTEPLRIWSCCITWASIPSGCSTTLLPEPSTMRRESAQVVYVSLSLSLSRYVVRVYIYIYVYIYMYTWYPPPSVDPGFVSLSCVFLAFYVFCLAMYVCMSAYACNVSKDINICHLSESASISEDWDNQVIFFLLGFKIQ